MSSTILIIYSTKILSEVEASTSKNVMYNHKMPNFKIHSTYKTTFDQQNAVDKLVSGYNSGVDYQVLLWLTRSGKTFTVANIIERLQKPALIIAHNKTLAAQLYQEF